jgi:hypothetical protein
MKPLDSKQHPRTAASGQVCNCLQLSQAIQSSKPFKVQYIGEDVRHLQGIGAKYFQEFQDAKRFLLYLGFGANPVVCVHARVAVGWSPGLFISVSPFVRIAIVESGVPAQDYMLTKSWRADLISFAMLI